MAKKETPVLSIRNLKTYFYFGRGKNKFIVKAIDDVSFDIFKGEVFGLVGESGCGKTTTGRTIIKLHDPTDGEVFFLGERIGAGILGNKEKIKQIRKETRVKLNELKIEEAIAIKAASPEKLEEVKENYKNKLQEVRDNKARIIAEQKEDMLLRKDSLIPKYDLMRKMQMIFQDPIASLNPRMTVKEIIAEGLRIAGNKEAKLAIRKAKEDAKKQIAALKEEAFQNEALKDSLKEKIREINNKTREFVATNKNTEKLINTKVNDVLETVGLLPEHASRYPHEFSGGQRQRIGIARALIVAPEFIIADEPISALDVSIQAQVINLLNDLRDNLGITIMFIAHDLSVIKYFSDRIGVMYYGNLVELAPADELFLNPLHPYTRSLLSAVPLPDPRYEKTRRRIIYKPSEVHNYEEDLPSLQEIKKGHFVFANEEEMKEYRKGLK